MSVKDIFSFYTVFRIYLCRTNAKFGKGICFKFTQIETYEILSNKKLRTLVFVFFAYFSRSLSLALVCLFVTFTSCANNKQWQAKAVKRFEHSFQISCNSNRGTHQQKKNQWNSIQRQLKQFAAASHWQIPRLVSVVSFNCDKHIATTHINYEYALIQLHLCNDKTNNTHTHATEKS